jgi:hypothetical protein
MKWTRKRQRLLAKKIGRGRNYLLCERNFPVAWPDPSHPGIGHLKKRVL